jgi:O-antigen/teichoic acid export membrane protein
MTGAGISQAMLLLSSIAMARILGKQQFGEFGVISNTVGMFSVFAGFGLGMTATKYVAEFRSKDPERAGRIIALSSLVSMATGAIFGVLLLTIAPWLATNTLSAPHLAGLLRLSAGFLFFAAVCGAQTGALAGFEAFRTIARLNVITGILSLPLLVGGVYIFGIAGGVAGLVITTAATCLMNSFALRSEMRRAGIPVKYAGCTGESRVLVGFSMPSVMAGILVNPVNWVCAAILVNQPSGYGEMGLYSAAASWQKAILFLPGCLNTIALPMLSGYFGSNQHDDFRKALRYNILLNGGSALAAALLISISAPYIMGSYGAGFAEGRIILVVISFSTVLAAVNSVAGTAIASTGRPWSGFIFNLLWGTALISIASFLIPKYGATGLAVSMLASYALHTLWQMYYVVRICAYTGSDPRT